MSNDPVRYTLNKNERLRSQKVIDKLFASGDSFIAYPLRVVYSVTPNDTENKPCVSMMVSVSKKRFKRAVKRNRVKRLVKEAYRLNKQGFADLALETGQDIQIAFLFLKNELPTFVEIEKAILKAIQLLIQKTTKVDIDPENELNP